MILSKNILTPDFALTSTNINVNIAKVIDAFGLGKIANPMEAHTGYAKDDRVVALIARGIGNGGTAPLVKEKCQLTEITD